MNGFSASIPERLPEPGVVFAFDINSIHRFRGEVLMDFSNWESLNKFPIIYCCQYGPI